MDVAIVPYDAQIHGRFVESEAMNAAEKWPHFLRRDRRRIERELGDIVRRATVAGRAVVAVVPEDPSLFVGYLVTSGPQAIAYAYVKYACRRLAVASRLAAAAGIDLGRPVSLDIWTPAASRIAAAGRIRLYPAIPHEQERNHEQHPAAEGARP